MVFTPPTVIVALSDAPGTRGVLLQLAPVSQLPEVPVQEMAAVWPVSGKAMATAAATGSRRWIFRVLRMVTPRQVVGSNTIGRVPTRYL